MAAQYNAVMRMQSPYTQSILLNTIKRRPQWHVADIPAKPVKVQADTQQYKSLNDAYWASKAVSSDNDSEQKDADIEHYIDTDFTAPEWQDVHLQIDEFERLAFERSMSAEQPIIISSYAVRKGLIRKSNMCYLLQKYALKRAQSCLTHSIPRTYLFELEDVDYVDEALSECYEVRDMALDGSEVYIMKAAMLDKGQSVHIITDPAQIYDICESQPDIRDYIIQQYITNPMLINQRKFHIRVYVLCVGNLTVYVHQEMLCLFATEQYSTDYTDTAAHITNTCINETHAHFDEAEQIQLLSEIVSDTDNAHITQQINECVNQVFECLHSEPMYFMPHTNGFELYGFDFMVDDNKHAYLLEANAQPNFAQTLNRLQYVVDNVIENTFQLAVDTKFGAAKLQSAPAEQTMSQVYQRINTTQYKMRYY